MMDGDRYELLLRLAGRLPDHTLARARDDLAAGAWGRLDAVLAKGDAAPPPGPVRAEESQPPYGFAPAGPAALAVHGDRIGAILDLTGGPHPALPGLADDTDAAAVAAVAGLPGAVGLWRAWRFPTHRTADTPLARVHLVEMSSVEETGPSSPAALTARLQDALRAAGQAAPAVELYRSGQPLPAYQRTARAASALLWARAPWRPVDLARVYDRGTPPYFGADHPIVSDVDERERLLSSLRGGVPLLVTASLLDDVVDGEPAVVPMDFRTDGCWIWSAATAYYLRRHGLAPDPLLQRHLSLVVPGPVDGVALHRAAIALST